MFKLSYIGLMGLCFLFNTFSYAMQEDEFFVSHEIFVDGGSTRENIGNLNFPQIGVYATPYHMALPLLAIQSKHIVDAMPDALLKQLAAMYHLVGPQELQKELYHKIATQELNVGVIFWKGLSSQPTVYNGVFHPTVGSWLGLNYTANFNVNINAGIFQAQGVRPAPDSSLAFDSLGILAVNRHDIDNYSPNNGKFAVEAGRAVATFWLMGTYNGRATISYNILLITPEVQKAIQDVAGTLAAIRQQHETNKREELAKAEKITDPQKKQQEIQRIQDRYAQLQNPVLELEQLMQGLEPVVKKLESEGKNADSAALYGSVELVRKLVAVQAPVQPEKIPVVHIPRVLQPRIALTPAALAEVQQNLILLESQLANLNYALSS